MSKSMIIKIAAGIILAAIAVPMVLFGGIWMEILKVSFTILASYEIAMASTGKPNWPEAILLAVIIEVIAHTPASLFPACAAVLIVILFLLHFIDESITAENVVYTFIMTMIIALAWQCAIRYYSMGYPGYGILYIFASCFICDTAAYFFGVFTGKHKMIPRISPNKTWEGAAGGYACAAAVTLIYGLAVCKFLPASLVIAGALTLPAVAEVGDLAFSAIKRHFGIKDFGSLIPGHGGVLDRIDSLVFCLMFFNALMIMWGIGV